MLLVGDVARVVHLGCRTGYPDLKIYERVAEIEIVGLDASLPALELARNKAAVRGAENIEYRVLEDGFEHFEPAQFSHAISLHPIVDNEERAQFFSDVHRLLLPGGQALLALPLR